MAAGSIPFGQTSVHRPHRLHSKLNRRSPAVATIWPAIFDRLVRHRGWTPERYARWFARSANALLYPERTP